MARKIARRAVLIGSVAIAGGVAFGGYYVTRPARNPLTAGAGEAALTPFVFIDREGVTLIAPRAEMGQGVRTTLAALIAEELDVDLDAVRVIHGPAAEAYYNGALILGFPAYDADGPQSGIAQYGMGVIAKVTGMQVTGGSSSAVDAFVRFREAGAAARETLKEAAARRWGVDRARLTTEGGVAIAPDGQRLSYVDLAADAAEIEVVSDTPLRPASEWRILGRPVPRVDMVEKATGTAVFGVDVRLPGMKFAALRMNPTFGGVMDGYSASAAEGMPGVERVIDLGGGIAVVARNTWLAQKAADAVEPNWTAAPRAHSTDAMFATIEAAFEGDPNSTRRDEGDLETWPEGAVEVRAEYRMPYLAHATMEPMNATALYEKGALTVWCGTQGPMGLRDRCAEAIGLSSEAVEVITTYLGGGFGRRAEYDFAVYAAKLAAAMEGTPVQLTWSREEDMTHDFYRPGAIARFRGAVKDGTAVMLDGQIAAQSCNAQFMGRMGAPTTGTDRMLVDGAADQPYAIPNYRIRGYVADLAAPVGFWRAVGYSVNGFMHDCFIDEMAHAAGAHPIDFRRQTIAPLHAPSAGVLAAVQDMSGWGAETPDGVGMGVGFTFSFGTPVAIVIRVEDRGGLIRMTNAWIACDVGLALDPAIVEAQMVSGMVYGLSAACFEEITFADGAVEQQNFPDYEVLRMSAMPKTEVTILETSPHMGGAGEPGTPPAMPAIANAVFDLTGRRPRRLPLARDYRLAI